MAFAVKLFGAAILVQEIEIVWEGEIAWEVADR